MGTQATDKCLDVHTLTKWGEWPVSEETRVYIRPCYIDLFAQCEKAWKIGAQGIFLKGIPGIGKSFFLNYALFRLVSERNRVLFFDGPSDVALLYDGGLEKPPTIVKIADAIAVRGGKRDYMAANVDYVLYDPHENPRRTQDFAPTHFSKKKFLVAMSPDPANCVKLDKDTNAKAYLFMGPMDDDEAEEMRQFCYSDITKEQVSKRFENAGGVARYLYRSVGRVDGEDAALNALVNDQTFAWSDLVQNPRRIDAGLVASEFSRLWSLYHLIPNATYTRYTIELCCANAYKKMRSHLLKWDVKGLWKLFRGTPEKQGTLRGIRYEAYVHKKIIAEGINLPARRLLATTVSQTETMRVSIPAKTKPYELRDNNVDVTLRTQYRAACVTGGYLLPDLPDFPVIDSAYVAVGGQYCVLLQMKAGMTNHSQQNMCRSLGY